MKKVLCLALCLLLLPVLPALSEEGDMPAPSHAEAALRPGETWDCGVSALSWDCDAPEVVSVSGSVVTGLEEGFATLCAQLPDGGEYWLDVTVSADAMPMLISSAVRFALQEWQSSLGQTFSDRNKYTAWYCGKGEKCRFGWCGAFVNYCLDTMGVPMDEPYDSVPHENGEPYAVYAAGVGKILTGFTRMERLARIPRPGYLVIYGQRDRYNTIHIGMVTDVRLREDGTYSVQTVEGNMSNRIKRYNYCYDPADTTEHNMSMLTEEEQTAPDTFQYKVQQSDWFVYTFCATYL